MSQTHVLAKHASAVRRFYQARLGLFVHYGLYSLLGQHEWVQLRERIPVAEYAKLADRFTAEKFDAKVICQLALDSGMKYVNLTTRHHDSFCLWDTKTTDFNTVKASACQRDLVAELADACRDAGLDLHLYVSHGRDWRHPHAPNNDQWGGSARPEYDTPEPAYAYGANHDLQRYVDYIAEQVRELLTSYGPIGSIWLDGIAVPLHPKDENGLIIEGFDPRHDGDVFQCQKLYDMVHQLQPSCLVSYKQGYLGTEDFFAPEHEAYNRFGKPFGPDRPGEVCTTMTPGSWGYHRDNAAVHLTAEQVWDKLRLTAAADCNLLLNTGLLPDGSLYSGDADTLRQVGQRISREGLPKR